MNEQRFSFPLEVKASGTAGIVEGYASTFNGPVDAFGDVIAPGCWTASLLEHKQLGSRPALLWAHDQSQPIGRFLDVVEDSHGLHVRGKLSLEVPRGQEAYALAKDDCLGWSVGFGLVRKSQDGPVRVIEEAKLAEVSLVAIPANPAARVTDVKSITDLESIRDYEQFLRGYGLSHKEAKRLSVGGWNAYKGQSLDFELAEYLDRSIHTFKRN